MKRYSLWWIAEDRAEIREVDEGEYVRHEDALAASDSRLHEVAVACATAEVRVQALEAENADLRHDLERSMQRNTELLNPQQSETNYVGKLEGVANFGSAVCQHDRTRPQPTLSWMGSSMDPRVNTHLFRCTVCQHSFDLPIGHTQSATSEPGAEHG